MIDLIAVTALAASAATLGAFINLVLLTDRAKRKAASKSVRFYDVLKGELKGADDRGVSEPHVCLGMRTSKSTGKIIPNATWSDEYLKSMSADA